MPTASQNIQESEVAKPLSDAPLQTKHSLGGGVSADNAFFQKGHFFMKKKMRWVYLEKCLYSPKQALTNNKMN